MKQKKGFTIIELIAVIAILAILVVLIAPSLLDSSKSSKEKLKQAKIETITYAAGNLAENNLETYSKCNSNSSNETIENECIISIKELIDNNYIDKDKGSDGIKDPTSDENINGNVLVCYNMNTGLFDLKYYEGDKIPTDGCSKTGINTLAIQHNSTLIPWNKPTEFETMIFTNGNISSLSIDTKEYKYKESDHIVDIAFMHNGTKKDKVDNIQPSDSISLKLSYTFQDDPIQFPKELKNVPISITLTGEYLMTGENRNSNTETLTTQFFFIFYDKVTSATDTLSVTIKPTKLLADKIESIENYVGFDTPVTLTCVQTDNYGCQIELPDISTYTKLKGPELEKIIPYEYISNNYLIDEPFVDYYILKGSKYFHPDTNQQIEIGDNHLQKGTHTPGTYRIRKGATATDEIENGSVLYIGIRGKQITSTYKANGGTISLFNGNTSETAYNVAYEHKYTEKYNKTDSVHSLEDIGIMKATRTGYTLNGWYTEKNGKGTKLTKNTKVTTTSPEFHAHWTANTYSIEYNANGGTGTMTNSTFTYDVESALSKNAFTRTGYTFIGWATTPSGKVIYDDEAKVKNLTSENNGTFKLYAKWKINEYTLTINPNGGTYSDSTKNTTVTLKYGQEYELLQPTKEYFNLTKWELSGFGTIKDSTFTMGAGNATLTAKWERKNCKYTVNYNLENIDDDDFTTHTIVTIDEFGCGNSATPEKKEFEGFEDITPTSEIIKTSGTIININYKRNRYSVTCSASGGTVSEETLTVKHDGTATCEASVSTGYKTDGASGVCIASDSDLNLGTYSNKKITVQKVTQNLNCNITFPSVCPAQSVLNDDGKCQLTSHEIEIGCRMCRTWADLPNDTCFGGCGPTCDKKPYPHPSEDIWYTEACEYIVCPEGWKPIGGGLNYLTCVKDPS